ncbi:hypothetical protein KC19_9G144600 [Ceratodon purpureus]|uniref:Uncharacterized protein n=1 Tax=Ceratodon purpureus TaxID=3225 RepID=A0A8T0GTT3_CERPU|nr:hypothetical protein KC19_9G144600 [Ceratodon purpureus]
MVFEGVNGLTIDDYANIGVDQLLIRCFQRLSIQLCNCQIVITMTKAGFLLVLAKLGFEGTQM